METSVLNQILEQHKLWLDGNGGKRADLRGANLEGANLRRANLTDANLNRADLRGANLEGANLNRANLTVANLNRANLTYANFEGADLEYARLDGANLTYANLTYANLEGANLRAANLHGAIIRDVNLQYANLQYANLTDAILPDISWIIPGCLVQLNQIKYEFYLEKEDKWVNFIQDSFGFIIQDNREEGTFDMLLGDRIIRNIPDWVKYSGLKQILADSKDKTND